MARVILLLSFASALFGQQSGLHSFAKNGKFGYLRNDGSVAIAPIYDNAQEFSEGLGGVAVFSGTRPFDPEESPKCVTRALKWGFVNVQGKVIIAPAFDNARPFSEGLASVRVNDQTGYIDRTGRLVISGKFQSGYDFHDGVAVVYENKRYGLIDVNGAYRLPAVHYMVDDADNGLVRVSTGDGGKAVFSTAGKLLLRVPENYESSGLYPRVAGGLIQVSRRVQNPVVGASIEGFMDIKGNLVVPAIYSWPGKWSEGLVAVSRDHKIGFVDATGKEVIPPQFDCGDYYRHSDFSFHDGIAAVCLSGKYGYIDIAGHWVIQPKFSHAEAFFEGLAGACVFAEDYGYPNEVEHPAERCGFINRSGSFVIPPQFDHSEDTMKFVDGFASVESNLFDVFQYQTLLVDKLGSVIYRPMPSDKFDSKVWGECSFPTNVQPPPPPPRVYSLLAQFTTDPPGAMVYLVPRWDWEQANNGAWLLGHPEVLRNYAIPEGPTPVNSRVKVQTYTVVFERGERRVILPFTIASGGPNNLRATLN